MNDGYVLDSRVTSQLKRASGILTREDLQEAYRYFNGVCPYSETPINDRDWHLEHIIPVTMGGTTDPWNCIPVCGPCNLSKGGKHLLDWWDKEHTLEEEYKLEKIFTYIVEQLNKPRDYKITIENDEYINKLVQEEISVAELDEESVITDENIKLDTFTFMYQLLNHLVVNKQYIKGNIDEYIKQLQITYNNNSQFERLDTDLFKLQNDLVMYLKSIGVNNHYSIAFTYSKKITNFDEVRTNMDNIRNYLQMDTIADLINKNPNILLMNVEDFSGRVEYIVNILNIPLDTLLEKISIISQTENLKELFNYCNSINYDFNDIPNYVFVRRKIKDISAVIEVCKANGIEVTGSVFQKSSEEIVKIIEVCKANGIEITGSVFLKNEEEIVKIIEVCKVNGIEVTGSVFYKDAEEILKIIELCKVNGIKTEGNVFLKSAEEILKIIEVCKANGIEVTGSVFQKSSEEIEKIIEVCKANGIEVTGSVFKKDAEEILKIIEVCKANGIEVIGSVFLKDAEEIEKIIEVCKVNEINVTGSVFLKSSKDINETCEYLRENYGSEYVKPLLAVISVKKLKNILPYLESMGVLPTVINSASILTLSLEEIQERKNVLDMLGESMVVGNRYNSIFGLSKKNYAKRLENLNISSGGRSL